MSVTSVSLIQREVKSLKPVVGYLLENKTKSGTLRSPRYYGHFFCAGETSIHFLIRKPRQSPREYDQRPHSDIPTCRILYKFRTFIPPFCNTSDRFFSFAWLAIDSIAARML